MSNIVRFDFDGGLHSFDGNGWFNATEAAKRFKREAFEWLRLPATKSYMDALAKALEIEPGKSRFELVKAQRGGRSPGTWLHPKLAVAFARWLSDDFGVWCDLQIDAIIRNSIRAEGNVNLLPLLLRQDAGAWELRFKPDYYEALAHITRTTYTGHTNGTPALYGAITDKWVYACLLPDDVRSELKVRRNASQKMHQWLTDGGQALLDKQIELVQSIASTSADMRDFEARMMLVSGRRGQLGFVYPKAA
ncbi:hypothetical protein CCO03_08750 [Comamonas serinivorans]|uniref:KilA-N domain-containing protein n=1 Tax=Comamonas serinivorans TaxID=1082851 RepID=A0A1Y0EM74_9BURK|nr:KilA-N domain-containing protein [Comamonas serinivorans]ARU04754.1 hypothetical protein CCO03_08750 [Comamonas serinivorans]